MNQLAQYERMRGEVQRCASIDEAAELRDKAAALAAYAKQRDDHELNVWMSEIKVRASKRIAELIRDLPTAAKGGAGGGAIVPPLALSKDDAIKGAGLSRREAYRLQELAGPRDKQAEASATAATEHYLATSRQAKTPPTIAGLRTVVREAVHSVIGKPQRQKPEPRVREVEPVGNEYMDLTIAVGMIAEMGADMEVLARKFPPGNARCLAAATEAAPKLMAWIKALENAQHEANRTAA